MPSAKRRFGDVGERIAEKCLIEKGYVVIDRNFRKRYGEIDIIAKKDGLLVFVEVKTRDMRNTLNFLPEQSVNRVKIRKLQKICQIYLLEKHCSPDQEWRIDIMAISVDMNSKKARVKHMENAVWEKQY